MADIEAPSTWEVRGYDEAYAEVLNATIQVPNSTSTDRILSFTINSLSIPDITTVPNLSGQSSGGPFSGADPVDPDITHKMQLKCFSEADGGANVIVGIYYLYGPPSPRFAASVIAVKT